MRRGLAVGALWAGLAAACACWTPAPGLAQPAGQGEMEDGRSADESRSQAFQAVEGAIEEDVPGGPLLVAAYGVIWLVIFGYAWRLIGLQRRTLEEIEALQRVLREAPDAASAAGGDAPGATDAEG